MCHYVQLDPLILKRDVPMLVGEEKPKEETIGTMTVMFPRRHRNSTATWNEEPNCGKELP